MSNGRVSNGVVGSQQRLGMQGQQINFAGPRPSVSWTDDLPVCHLSGVGLSTNQIYREDGNRQEEHEFEDRNFHFRQEDAVYLYGVFDGHGGSRVADFAKQRMPAELLLGQLSQTTSDAEIRDVLRQAFLAVENAYFESVDALLAEKTTKQDQLPEGINTYNAYMKYPVIMNELKQLEQQLSGGTTATVVVIFNNKIFVANVGDTRAILVKTTSDGLLSVLQLTKDHTLSEINEQIRLAELGLDVERLKSTNKIGNSHCTRCIGDHNVKGGYRDIDYLSCAANEPVIPEPFVDGGIPVDDNCSFLIIMSNGLYKALSEALNKDSISINLFISQMVATELKQQHTLNGVAQGVVDKVVRIHHDTFLTGTVAQKRICQKRDDITLLVRKFSSHHLPPLNIPHSTLSFANFTPLSTAYPHPIMDSPVTPTPSFPGGSNSSGSGSGLGSTSSINSVTESTMSSQNQTATGTFASGYSTQSSGEGNFISRQMINTQLELDSEGRIKPYVDFSEFFNFLEQMTEEQKQEFENELRPRTMCDPIQEEGESMTLPEH